MIRRVTSYLFAIIDTFLRLLGLSAMEFAITSKVSDEDESRRYEQEVMEFGSSLEFVIISTVALLNLACLAGGLCRIIVGGWSARLDVFSLQIVLCGALVATNIPIYEAMFVRKDKGRLPLSVTLASIGLVMSAILIYL